VSVYDWRIPTDADTYLRQQEKRVMREERRPIIGSASDLLGPGAGPHANLINDWSSEAGAFVGVYYSDPTLGQTNSPNDALYWMGETFATGDGYGFQRLTQVDPSGATLADPLRYTRHFASPSGVAVFQSWIQHGVTPPAVWTSMTSALTSGTARWSLVSGMVTVQIDGAMNTTSGTTAIVVTVANSVPASLRPTANVRMGGYFGGHPGTVSITGSGEVSALQQSGAVRGSVSSTLMYPVG
jgi:hypothetical protein